jgi:DNA polymerase III epsilon subunit-like protein
MTGWFSTLRARYLSRTTEPAVPRWLADLPGSILFVDVQTTGLSAADRVVTFGAIQLITAPLRDGLLDLETAHFIFNPRRLSFGRAEELHGYSDWILRHQDKFYLHADRIEDLLESSDLIVIHDAEVGLKFLNRELALDGRHPIWRPTYCTMKAFQRLRRRGEASLDAVCRHLDLPPLAQPQSALERAWVVLLAYLWLNKCPYQADCPAEIRTSPTNLKSPPRLPASLLPKGQRHSAGLVRRPAAKPNAGPFQVAARPAPGHELPAPAAIPVRSEPAPAIAAVSMPAIPAAAEELVLLPELVRSSAADGLPAACATIETSVSLMPASDMTIDMPAILAPTAADAAAPKPADQTPMPSPFNDMTAAGDGSPAKTGTEQPIELPEVLMAESEAAGPAMPPDALLHSPAGVILPTLAYEAEQPAQPAAREAPAMAN